MKSEIHEFRQNKLFRVSKRVVMLLAVLLGTTFMANANTITKKAATTKEVKAKVIKKQKKAKKVAPKTTSTTKPVTAPAKK